MRKVKGMLMNFLMEMRILLGNGLKVILFTLWQRIWGHTRRKHYGVMEAPSAEISEENPGCM
jgi:hypothetical protein